MHGVYLLKEEIIEELEKYGERGEISRSELPTIDMLAHTAKNLCKLIDMCEERTGYSYGSGEHMYSSRRMPHVTYSYRGPRRDSMGRYASDDDWMIDTLHELKEKAPNDRMRAEFDEFISRMERSK